MILPGRDGEMKAEATMSLSPEVGTALSDSRGCATYRMIQRAIRFQSSVQGDRNHRLQVQHESGILVRPTG